MRFILSFFLLFSITLSSVIWSSGGYIFGGKETISSSHYSSNVDTTSDSSFLVQTHKVRGKRRLPFHAYHIKFFVNFVLPATQLPVDAFKYLVFQSQYIHHTPDRPPAA